MFKSGDILVYCGHNEHWVGKKLKLISIVEDKITCECLENIQLYAKGARVRISKDSVKLLDPNAPKVYPRSF